MSARSREHCIGVLNRVVRDRADALEMSSMNVKRTSDISRIRSLMDAFPRLGNLLIPLLHLARWH